MFYLKKGAYAPYIFSKGQRVKVTNLPSGRQGVLIPEAAHRETVWLNVVVPAVNAEVVIQATAPGERIIVLRRTPPDTALANEEE